MDRRAFIKSLAAGAVAITGLSRFASWAQPHLAALGSSISGFYTGHTLVVLSGKGAGQARRIVEYNGSTKVATFNVPWRGEIDGTSTFVVLPPH